ncbi:SDR family oxidoreductase [Pyxidicoccus caerfyrddinensis]|uniref:SDR family oxidoreductase n=1 Tax=Pyxidicoccus caerfyrddinensis TaxID=2709663 RepID=UPI0013DB289B|nr:SDR family oxidoreductase [Pyxidicoccus caerfyrddinensis]
MVASQGRVVLITGASSGIGRACAELLSERGHTVYGTSRQPLTEAPKGWRWLELDVTRDDSVRRAVDAVLAAEGRIDVVVNNAGYALAGSLEDTSIEEARQQFETNLLGVLRVCKAVLPSMRERRSGLFIHISSLGGAVGLPFQGLYSASKFALEGLTESLRQEVAPFGIQATLVQPGDVHTRITENRVLASQSGQGSAYRAPFETALKTIEADERDGVPPEDVARTVLELLEHGRVRVRYSVGKLVQRAAVMAKWVLPSRAFEALVMSLYGLSRD